MVFLKVYINKIYDRNCNFLISSLALLHQISKHSHYLSVLHYVTVSPKSIQLCSFLFNISFYGLRKISTYILGEPFFIRKRFYPIPFRIFFSRLTYDLLISQPKLCLVAFEYILLFFFLQMIFTVQPLATRRK